MVTDQSEILELNIIIISLVISYLFGANNAGTSWSTAYSTNALNPRKAVFSLWFLTFP